MYQVVCLIMMDIKMSLNDKQRLAVLENSQSLLVLAGAGTGKTRFLCAKILYLLNLGNAPNSIVAITFTKKAAKEMNDRVKKYYKGKDISFIGTFHSFGVSILRSFGEKINIPSNFIIADSSDSISIIKRFLRQQNLEPKKASDVYRLISKLKGISELPETFSDNVYEPFNTKVFLKIWNNYEITLRENSMLDFNDLIGKCVLLLENSPEIKKELNNKYKHILIDEFQDIDNLQSKFIQLLKGSNSNIYAVGDMDQNIYEWRGADASFALDFADTYEPSKVFTLEENYRSTKTIVGAANEVIKRNKMRFPRELKTKKSGGEKISLYINKNAELESYCISQEIEKLVEKGVKYNDIVVLYRNNFQSRILERVFLQENIPYIVVGQKFFERSEIKDICSYIRYICVNKNISDLDRIINTPTRSIGGVSKELIFNKREDDLSPIAEKSYRKFIDIVENLKSFAKNHTLFEIAKKIIDEVGYIEYIELKKDDAESRILNIKELLSFLSTFDGNAIESANTFFESIALQTDQDEITEKDNGTVTLMTVHSSKGLEFPYVFISGLEDGLFPSLYEDSENRIESERRLFYVAITRAMLKVYLCSALERFSYGDEKTRSPSRFLSEIPSNYISLETLEDSNDINF